MRPHRLRTPPDPATLREGEAGMSGPDGTVDAVVVGAGPNGLVAANRLADAGWSVLLLEAQPQVGGAVASDSELHPDFVHDTFSAFYPLAVASAAMRDLDLESHGLVWEHAPAVLGHPQPDGRWAMLHREREHTAAGLESDRPGDGERWLEWCRTWDVVGGPMVDALTSPFPPVLAGARTLASVVRGGGLDLGARLASSAAELAEDFAGDLPGLLLAGNAGHADLPIDAAGSGVFGVLMTMLGQSVGFPVPRGGATGLAQALARRLRAAGGEIRTGVEVTRVEVRAGRATAVHTRGGERVAVRHAVLADVVAPRLFGGLVHQRDVPRGVARGMHRFRLDPGTVKVDWALSGPVPWASAPPVPPGTVHMADSVADMVQATAQVAAGVVPAHPFMLAGQMTTTDPTRSPAGTESMWAYTHVPQPASTRADAGGDGITGRWDRDEEERMADRMQASFERLAPGFGSRILARRVLGPHDLEARNASLIGGAINGGTAQVQQQLFFRPVPAMRGRPETGITGLYLASASAHPGGGVHGAAGNNAARAAIRHRRWSLRRA